MALIEFLGRSRFAALLAWLAAVSLGALAPAASAAVPMRDGVPQLASKRAAAETPAHVVRVAAIKPAAASRSSDDDRRPIPGPDPALVHAAPVSATRFAANIVTRTTPRPAARGRALRPYGARAPPAFRI